MEQVLADMLFQGADECYRAGHFEAMDWFINGLDIGQLEIQEIIILLVITNWARQKLKSRENLVKAAEKRIGELDPVRLERLMKGLR
jgi:hypothetical protein